jgi:hypothetical protein
MPIHIKYIIAGAFIAGIGLSIYFISAGDLTSKESALVSVILTVLAILATWVITHIYTQSQHQKAIDEVQKSHLNNLRTYALKAAEKVNNLSNELNRLAAYLQEALEYDETTDNIHDSLLSDRERIESAIHIINTLKSVNDTALSDWEGVIGEELDKQRVRQEEKEQELAELIDRLESLSDSQVDAQKYAEDTTQTLSREMESIRRDIRSMASTLGLTPVRFTKPFPRKARVDVSTTCPQCGQPVEYRQKEDVKSVKTFKCKSCNAQLVATYDRDNKFMLQKRVLAQEQVTCLICNTPITIQLDTVANASRLVQCTNCHSQLTATRTVSGITLKTRKITPQPVSLTPEILELVRNTLPPQPWPVGTSKLIAEKLGLPPRIVSEAIAKLTLRGDIDLQYFGKLYVPKPNESQAEPSNTQDAQAQTNNL